MRGIQGADRTNSHVGAARAGRTSNADRLEISERLASPAESRVTATWAVKLEVVHVPGRPQTVAELAALGR
jgi:hypothetical protein